MVRAARFVFPLPLVFCFLPLSSRRQFLNSFRSFLASLGIWHSVFHGSQRYDTTRTDQWSLWVSGSFSTKVPSLRAKPFSIQHKKTFSKRFASFSFRRKNILGFLQKASSFTAYVRHALKKEKEMKTIFLLITDCTDLDPRSQSEYVCPADFFLIFQLVWCRFVLTVFFSLIRFTKVQNSLLQWRFVRELVPRRRQHEFRCSAVCTIGDVWEMRLKVRVTQYSNEIRLSPIACIFSSTSRYGAAGRHTILFLKVPVEFHFVSEEFLNSFWLYTFMPRKNCMQFVIPIRGD